MFNFVCVQKQMGFFAPVQEPVQDHLSVAPNFPGALSGCLPHLLVKSAPGYKLPSRLDGLEAKPHEFNSP